MEPGAGRNHGTAPTPEYTSQHDRATAAHSVPQRRRMPFLGPALYQDQERPPPCHTDPLCDCALGVYLERRLYHGD